MTPVEIKLQILLSEKEHADRQIAGFAELQIKLLAFLFAATSAALGLALAKKDQVLSTEQLVIVILVGSIVGCAIILQSVVMYGLSLGQIYYKKHILGRQLADLLGPEQKPMLRAVEAFNESGAATPVFLASTVLVITHIVATAALLTYAAGLIGQERVRWSGALLSAFIGSWLLLGLTVTTELVMATAMRVVGSGKGQPKETPNEGA